MSVSSWSGGNFQDGRRVSSTKTVHVKHNVVLREEHLRSVLGTRVNEFDTRHLMMACGGMYGANVMDKLALEKMAKICADSPHFVLARIGAKTKFASLVRHYRAAQLEQSIEEEDDGPFTFEQ